MTLKEIHLGLKKVGLLIKNRNNRPRCRMLDLAMDFVRHSKVDGDYFEFGVYRGITFQYAYHSAQLRERKAMHFFALDSFQGFADPKGNDTTGVIVKGTRDCSEEEFCNIVRSHGVDMRKVHTIPGWFEQTLTGQGKQETKEKIGNRKAAVVYLDADLYEPTVLALDFLVDYLTDGTLLLFDNWFLFRGHPERGERRAFEEWCKKHPELIITPFNNFGWHGASFIVNLKLAASPEMNQ